MGERDYQRNNEKELYKMEGFGSPGGKGCPGTSMMNEKKSQTIKLNYKSKEKNDLKSLQTKTENKTEKHLHRAKSQNNMDVS